MRDLILVLIFVAALPWMLRRPAIGVLFWVAFGLLNPHRLAWGFAYTLPFAQTIAIVTAIGLLFSTEPRRIKGGAATVVLALFVVWMLITTQTALVPDRADYMLERVLKIQFGTFLALVALYKREHVLALVWVIALSIGFYAVKGGVFTLLTLGQYRVWGPAESFIAENNALALATVITIPLWAYLYTQTRPVWLRLGIIACAGLSAVSVFGSHSRGALLAILAMSGFLLLKSRRKFTFAVILLTGGSLLFAFMPDIWVERMQSIRDYREETSANARLETWKMLFNLALDRPILGGGFEPYKRWVFDVYNPSFGASYSAHSIYFQTLGEHGFPGLFLFLLFWLLVWLKCSSVARLAKSVKDLDWAYWLAQMIKVSIIGYLVGGAFLNLAYWDMPYYLFVAIAVAHAHLVRSHANVSKATSAAISSSQTPGLELTTGDIRR